MDRIYGAELSGKTRTRLIRGETLDSRERRLQERSSRGENRRGEQSGANNAASGRHGEKPLARETRFDLIYALSRPKQRIHCQASEPAPRCKVDRQVSSSINKLGRLTGSAASRAQREEVGSSGGRREGEPKRVDREIEAPEERPGAGGWLQPPLPPPPPPLPSPPATLSTLPTSFVHSACHRYDEPIAHSEKIFNHASRTRPVTVVVVEEKEGEREKESDRPLTTAIPLTDEERRSMAVEIKYLIYLIIDIEYGGPNRKEPVSRSSRQEGRDEGKKPLAERECKRSFLLPIPRVSLVPNLKEAILFLVLNLHETIIGRRVSQVTNYLHTFIKRNERVLELIRSVLQVMGRIRKNAARWDGVYPSLLEGCAKVDPIAKSEISPSLVEKTGMGGWHWPPFLAQWLLHA
ncbi:hypothetical protein G5I_04783 [Acromyrmex echinatior]|uniref:Uncharacterized protein n=1 Tax=Acromyrmex echinatior TaxID=103372 RepID=F4WGK2_ACREC|nr:hypothetical protein G5I_04783 [Acromyrmex echinatior]